ncbi:MAG: M28 family peptidase [Chloroflexi bacterium]|nr:M28 family peptidase [Chloroflexota bacterium]
MRKPWHTALFILILATLACSTVSPINPPVEVDSTVPPVVVMEPSVAAEPPTQAAPVGEPTIQPVDTLAPENPFGDIARGHIEALTAIGARASGSDNERAAGQYILDTFKQLGYTPETQSFSAWDADEYEFTSSNVIAVKKGTSTREIIVGVHYDSGNESLGADDNASGVGVMLEVAAHIVRLETPYTIRFIAFGSEENDLDGSYHYVELMGQPARDNTIVMVNLDSLAAGDNLYIYSDEGQNAFLRDWVLTWAGGNGLPLQTIRNVNLENDGYIADYGAFKDQGIPYIYFEATNWTLGDQDGYTQVDPQYGDEGYIWHTQYDNLTYLDATFPGRVNEHMRIFVSALYAICTEFELP